MRKNITDEFTGTAEKNLTVFYNDDTGEFEVWYNEEYSENFYDNPEENTIEKVQEFIDRW